MSCSGKHRIATKSMSTAEIKHTSLKTIPFQTTPLNNDVQYVHMQIMNYHTCRVLSIAI